MGASGDCVEKDGKRLRGVNGSYANSISLSSFNLSSLFLLFLVDLLLPSCKLRSSTAWARGEFSCWVINDGAATSLDFSPCELLSPVMALLLLMGMHDSEGVPRWCQSKCTEWIDVVQEDIS